MPNICLSCESILLVSKQHVPITILPCEWFYCPKTMCAPPIPAFRSLSNMLPSEPSLRPSPGFLSIHKGPQPEGSPASHAVASSPDCRRKYSSKRAGILAVETRPIQGILRGSDEKTKGSQLCPCGGGCGGELNLTRPILGLGPQGVTVLLSGNLAFSLAEAGFSV